jgi:hypothetical protein
MSEEDFDQLNHAIDGRIEVEFAFIEAMRQEFQRIRQSLDECIWRHKDDYQLALVGKDLGQLERFVVPQNYDPSYYNMGLGRVGIRNARPILPPNARVLAPRKGGKLTKKRSPTR